MKRPLRPFVNGLTIVDKSAELLNLGEHLTEPQSAILDAVETSMVGGGEVRTAGGIRRFDRPAPVRIIVLKARQMGVSTLIGAIIFTIAMMRARTRSLIVSHDNDSSEHLLSISRRYWDTSFINQRGIYTPKNLAGSRLGWVEPDTQIRISTARNLASGRSHTVHALHASEVGFWDRGKELMTGLSKAVPRTPLSFIFLESTANGYGNFFKASWDAAVAGESQYLPMFHPWWQHTEYTADHIGMGHVAGRPLMNLDEEERRLVSGFKRLGLDDRDIRSKLIWRREILATECNGDIDVLHQEYPSTPGEAFISSGRNVFKAEHLAEAYEPLEGERGEIQIRRGRPRFVPDRTGDLTVWKHPSPSGWYMIGADAAKQAQGDYAVACVIDRSTWEQVAEWRADVDPTTFAEVIMDLGRYFNDAMLCPETNMSGGAVAEIVRSNYDNVYIHSADAKVRGQMANQYGFNTNVQTKPEAIGNLKRALLDRFNDGVGISFHSGVLFNEASGYVLTDSGQYRNSQSEEQADHDDTVMAWALAVTATIHRAGDDDRPSPAPRARAAAAGVKAVPATSSEVEGLAVEERPVYDQIDSDTWDDWTDSEEAWA
ncbi:MAG: hypothetical protein ACF8PN_08215 [Phycisphaerales bacterium]